MIPIIADQAIKYKAKIVAKILIPQKRTTLGGV